MTNLITTAPTSKDKLQGPASITLVSQHKMTPKPLDLYMYKDLLQVPILAKPRSHSLHTFVQTVCGTRKHIVHLIRHAARLGHKAHRPWPVQFAGHNVLQSPSGVPYPEGPSLQTPHYDDC